MPGDDTEKTEAQPLSIFLNEGTTPLGRLVTSDLTAGGAQVISAVHSAKDAKMVRSDGALPVYADPFRADEIANVLKMAEVTTIINLTPMHANGVPFLKQDWVKMTEAVERGTAALMEAAQRTDVSFLLHTSYAFLQDGAHEDAFLSAALAAENRVLNSDVDGCVLRIGFLYGPNSNLQTLNQVMMRGRPMLTGNQHSANWIRTEDAAEAIVLAARQQPANEIMDVVDDKPVSTAEFMTTFATKLGLSTPANIPAFAAGPLYGPTHKAILGTSVSLTNDQAKETLNWTPKYPDTDAGIEDLLLTWRARTTV